MPASEPKLTLTREPRPLTPEYHKARKQLMFWSAILFVWELIGIDLEKAKEAGGNAGAIIGALKSPQAVPWVLVIMVLYFAFKLRTEWLQCNETRRQVREAKQDYYLAFIVAAAACALYIGQTIWRIQFADLLTTPVRIVLLVVFMAVGMGLVLNIKITISALMSKQRVGWLRWLQLCYFPSMIALGVITVRLQQNSRDIIFSLCVIAGAALLCWPWLRSLRQKRKGAEPEKKLVE